jgi:hypothetical protein
MVIGERFAWGHLPKAAGEATRAMFLNVPDLVLFADPSGTWQAHQTFADRREEVEGKVLALNIRRLPAWLLSREQHRARWGVHPENRPMPMPSPAEMASSMLPDERLGGFVNGAGLEIERWLRAEHLFEDFLEFVTDFAEVSDETRARIENMGRINFNVYNRSLSEWFTSEQIEQLYARNPLWAGVEERVYGDLALTA